MKNILGMILLLAITAGTAVGQNVMSIAAGSTASGDTGSFSVVLKNDVRINGLNVVVRYDPAVLSPLNISPAGSASSLNGPEGVLFGGNRINFLLFDKGAGMLGADSQAIFNIRYKVARSLHDSMLTALTFTEGSAADSNLVVVPLEFVDGGVLVSPEVGVRDRTRGVPSAFDLFQNFPNPFNPMTKIQFSMPRHARVTIVIFNLLGQKVSTLLDQVVSPGDHTITWDADAVSSGVYFCRMNAAGFSKTTKLMLLK